jgi:hypothetical protein
MDPRRVVIRKAGRMALASGSSKLREQGRGCEPLVLSGGRDGDQEAN